MLAERWAKLKWGLGFDNDGQATWGWASRVRGWLSLRLGIGHWFGAWEECERCGASAYDAEFQFQRVGRGRARCLDDGSCEYEAGRG